MAFYKEDCSAATIVGTFGSGLMAYLSGKKQEVTVEWNQISIVDWWGNLEGCSKSNSSDLGILEG